ncbi:hypothetical protein DyAD56_14095 [Dyella sp. AD56]|nr:hypothetical protein DyAD56_14095 [Dyella sp. AD56]
MAPIHLIDAASQLPEAWQFGGAHLKPAGAYP